MGIVMEQAGLMVRLFSSIQSIMARIRGSLFIAVLIVSTIFAAATGIVGASVTLLGIMAGATMSRSGYDVKLAGARVAVSLGCFLVSGGDEAHGLEAGGAQRGRVVDFVVGL